MCNIQIGFVFLNHGRPLVPGSWVERPTFLHFNCFCTLSKLTWAFWVYLFLGSPECSTDLDFSPSYTLGSVTHLNTRKSPFSRYSPHQHCFATSAFTNGFYNKLIFYVKNEHKKTKSCWDFNGNYIKPIFNLRKTGIFQSKSTVSLITFMNTLSFSVIPKI